MNDIFSQLIAVSWRGISFPVASFSASLEQDLVEHKYVNQDGAHIEAVGRAPLQFSARAMFRNGIVRGPAEEWGTLYPDGWRAFMTAAADRSTADLMHPELGAIRCKLRSAQTQWDGGVRDGVDVEVTWIESTDSGAELKALLAKASPISTVVAGAWDLDATLSDDAKRIAAGLTGPRVAEPSFADMVNGIQAISDTVGVLQRRSAGMLDAAVYRARLVADSVTRTADPKQWPAKRAAAMVEDAAYNLERDGLIPRSATNGVAIYRTPRVMTLATIAAAVHRDVQAIIRLNPRLVGAPSVPAETNVRYAA